MTLLTPRDDDEVVMRTLRCGLVLSLFWVACCARCCRMLMFRGATNVRARGQRPSEFAEGRSTGRSKLRRLDLIETPGNFNTLTLTFDDGSSGAAAGPPAPALCAAAGPLSGSDPDPPWRSKPAQA